MTASAGRARREEVSRSARLVRMVYYSPHTYLALARRRELESRRVAGRPVPAREGNASLLLTRVRRVIFRRRLALQEQLSHHASADAR